MSTDWKQNFNNALRILLVLFCLILAGCGVTKQHQCLSTMQEVTVQPTADTPLANSVPVFILPGAECSYNRIGTVKADSRDGKKRVLVDPEYPTIYGEEQHFITDRGNYINRIYRVHFEKVPFSLVPFNLGAGNNVGLLVIITFDKHEIPLLVTTVNTCGCYAVVIPTTALPEDAYPDDWQKNPIKVYGERLPNVLPAFSHADLLQIMVRPEVHRVMAVQVVSNDNKTAKDIVNADLLPLERLKNLPYENGDSASLYYNFWPVRGLVKGSIKWWETLLLSLPSLDLFIGMDKEYVGDKNHSDNPFYTSLKPWNRHTSDMNNFVRFLFFRGWKL